MNYLWYQTLDAWVTQANESNTVKFLTVINIQAACVNVTQFNTEWELEPTGTASNEKQVKMMNTNCSVLDIKTFTINLTKQHINVLKQKVVVVILNQPIIFSPPCMLPCPAVFLSSHFPYLSFLPCTLLFFTILSSFFQTIFFLSSLHPILVFRFSCSVFIFLFLGYILS